jgi:sugar phosphate isomerase/epimerase
MRDDRPRLLMWGGCLYNHPLLVRADCLRQAGFDAMSAFAGDVARERSRLGSLAAVRSELRRREAPIACLDVYLGWHPGFTTAGLSSAVASYLSAGEAELLEVAATLEIEAISAAAPIGGRHASVEQMIDGIGRFTDRAGRLGVRVALEISAGSQVGDLATARALLRGVERDNLGLLLDTYNLWRAGIKPEDLAGLSAEDVFYVQIVDAPLVPAADRYEESLHHRQLPGRGALPLLDYLRRIASLGPLPPLGPEIFNDDLTRMDAAQACAACFTATQQLLAKHEPELADRPGPDRGGSLDVDTPPG